MTNVTGVQGPGVPQAPEPTGAIVPGKSVLHAQQAADSVEISTAAKLAMKIREIPDIRADLVACVKAEMVAGTYETPERLEIAVDRLFDELFPGL